MRRKANIFMSRVISLDGVSIPTVIDSGIE